MTTPPPSPRLFLVDGYALIYRAFFALISRPLTTSRGENTSAAWGVVNFLNRLLATHRPEYLGWVHDSGLSFRHETYEAYKATREKLTEELQSDFDRGMERICELLEAYRIPILSLPGYEADDVIGTLAQQAADGGLNVVIVSGDKDFQQLVRPNVWLLNPGRGGPASVEEQWVGMENANERLGVPPHLVTDYLALVGDTSDNVPGVKGIGDKGAAELVTEFGPLEQILANVDKITKKRPREALQSQEREARLSKELVTIRCDLPMTLDLDAMRVEEPDRARLRDIFVSLEFHTLAREAAAALPATPRATPAGGTATAADTGLPPTTPSAVAAGAAPAAPELPTNYVTVDTIEALERAIARARHARHIAVDTEVVIDANSPTKIDPMRSTLVAISMAVGAGEAYYFPIAHREWAPMQPGLGLTDRDRGDDADVAGLGTRDFARVRARNRAAARRKDHAMVNRRT